MRMRTSALWRILAVLFLTLAPLPVVQSSAHAAHPRSTIAAVAAASAKCDPQDDLTGLLDASQRAQVTNRSSTCTYAIGYASYRMFDTVIDHQVIFDWVSKEIGPNQTLMLDVSLPSCATQLDLFYGPVLTSLNGVRYDKRKLATRYLNTGQYCVRAVPQCTLFAVNRDASQQSQFLAIDLRNQVPIPLASPQLRYDITGLAIHPSTQTLYALSGERADSPGQLYTVDGSTGGLALLGSTGFQNLHGLAFRQTDATVWAWEAGSGLVQIDTATGAGTRMFASTKQMSDLAWSNDGATLYAIGEKSLWTYHLGDSTLTKMSGRFPKNASALEMRPDGLLLGVQRGGQGVTIFAYDLTRSRTVAEIDVIADQRDLAAIAWPANCGNPSAGGQATMIKGVTVDKQRVCVGEDVLVTVRAEHPEALQNPVSISIDGQWGSSRYFQFTGAPGRRVLQIVATTAEGHVDTKQATVDVIACDTTRVFPLVAVRLNPFHPQTVDFEVVNAEAFSAAGLTYNWTFGDGQSAQTTVPFASHLYSMGVDQQVAVFQADLTLRRDALPDAVVHKTVALWSLYGLNRARGYVQPPVYPDRTLRNIGPGFVGAFTLENLEDESIFFTERQFEYQFCDPQRQSAPQAPENWALELIAKQQAARGIFVPTSAVGPDVCYVSVVLMGNMAGGLRAYASMRFKVRENPFMVKRVTDPALSQLLKQVVDQGWLGKGPADTITEGDLYRLAREHKITWPLPATTSANASVMQLADLPIGQECTPGAPIRLGLSCELTSMRNEVSDGINALKGDVVLAGGCGVTRTMFSGVDPQRRPQPYAQAGIMTQNYNQVTYAPVSIDRIINSITEGASPEFPDKALRFGQPGVEVKTVTSAFTTFPDADCKDETLISPVVVKPRPESVAAVRNDLIKAADQAAMIKAHSSLYAYTKADLNDPTSEGTIATLGSTFIWRAFSQAQVPLEGTDLEGAPVDIDPTKPDGLYVYTDAERRASADAIYSPLESKIEAQPSVGSGDSAGKLTNQFLNCMIGNYCAGKSVAEVASDVWKQPGLGWTVSPSDIQQWDVFGYTEAVTTALEYVPVHEVQARTDNGAIAGRVLLQNEGVGAAAVHIIRNDPNGSQDGQSIDVTAGDDGGFADTWLPPGNYTVIASTTRNGLSLTKRASVTITAGQTTRIDLVIELDQVFYREVKVFGTVEILDHENKVCLPFVGCFPDDERGTLPINETRVLNLVDKPQDAIHLGGKGQFCVGDEVRVELDLGLKLKGDNQSVETSGEARLFEGTDCDTDEREDTKSIGPLHLTPNANEAVDIELKNPYLLGDGDWAKFHLTVLNLQVPRAAATAITAAAGGTLSAPDGSLEVAFPAGAVTASTSVVYNRLAAPAHPLSPGLRALHSFTLDAHQPDGTAVSFFQQPYSLTLRYNDIDLANSGIDESQLRLAYWDGAAWNDVLPCAGCALDTANNRITVALDHFTEFALIGPARSTIFLPLVRN